MEMSCLNVIKQRLIESKYRGLAKILTKQLYLKWNNNMSELLKIQGILEYSNKFKKAAKILINNRYRYIDHHDGKEYRLSLINICYFMDKERNMIREEKNKYFNPTIWIFPGGKCLTQCKNQLYVGSNNLQLITALTGTTLDYRDQCQLQKG